MRTLMKTYFLTPLLALLLILGMTACGKKGPPVPPKSDDKQQQSPPRESEEYRRGTPF